MPAQTARSLSESLGVAVAWSARGRIGARARDVRLQLLDQAPRDEADVVVLSVGVNDVTSGCRTTTFKRDLEQLLGAVRKQNPRALVALAGLPPLGHFPLLPQPLRTILGWRARWFDRVVERATRDVKNTRFVPVDFETTPSAFSEDGYHPSPDSHRIFGDVVASAILQPVRARIEARNS